MSFVVCEYVHDSYKLKQPVNSELSCPLLMVQSLLL